MAGLSRKISFFFLFLLVILLAAAVAGWGIVQLHWPIWLGAAMGAGVIACFLFILFLKKYLIRRREKKLVEHIVEQGSIIDESAVPDQLHIKELEKNWAANLALLRSSHLRRKGANPVYALPWYLSLGATGMGKTSAVSNSGLPASFTEVEQNNEVLTTRNCDWWFLDKAIILDTAGRYSIPIEGMADQDEWKRFLSLLAKHRKKEPLNGILLFIAADILTDLAPDLLKKQGQLLRNRINNLMRTIGYKIPVRLIVTRMDKVAGFTGFASSLAPSDCGQVMGYWNRKATPFWSEVLNNAMKETGERLRELRLEHVLDDGRSEPDFLVFPAMFEGLHTGLTNFLEPVFSENRFQETPYLAGIYFGSGQCDSVSLTADPSTREMTTQGAATGQAFFFTDLFSRILADGRERLEPVKEFILWRQMTHNLGFMSWWLFCLFCAGLIGLSFMHNQRSLVKAAMVHVPFQTSTSEDSNVIILGLEKLRLNIIDLEELNRSSKLPDIGFTQSSRAEKELKQRYCALFESSIQQPMENGLARVINEVDQNTPDYLFADYAAYAIEHINLLQDYLAGKPPKTNSDPNPAAARILNLEDTTTFSEVAAFFADLNNSYLDWSDDRDSAASRLKNLQSYLAKLLATRVDDASWLYHPLITRTNSVKLGDFWYHKIPKEYEIFSVPGAFTENGRHEITAFLDKASKAGEAEVIEELRHRFKESYENNFFTHWYTFAEDFQVGRASLAQGTDWRETAIRMTTSSNPYFAIIETMAKELKSFAKEKEAVLPPWAEAVVAFDKVWKLAVTSRKAEGKKISSFAARVKVAKEQFMEKSASKVGADKVGAGKAEFFAVELHLAAAWDEYEKTLAALEAATPYKEKTFQLLSNWFREAVSPGEEASLYGKTYHAMVTLRGLARGKYDNSLAWRLVEGPFDFLAEFGLRESAAVLQGQWREQVVAQADNVDKDKLPGLLFEDAEGVVWKFIKTTAGPFLQKTVHGYRPRNAFDKHLTFEHALYTFLDKGAALVINKQSEYRVTITNRPMEVNKNATEEPYASIITVQCAEDRIVLENDNYPRSQTFTWSPDKCGDVNLTIEFPGVTLHKHYGGSMAFARFLNSFVDGALHFTPADFPGGTGHLRDANIKKIMLTYAVTGQKPVLRLLHRKPVVPKVIILPEQQGDISTIEPEDKMDQMELN